MVFGIGTDLIEIDRIERSIKKFGDHFINKIFTEVEKEYSNSKGSPFQHFAARFAAKEAIAKALATPNNKGFNWHDIEVFNEPNGFPSARLFGEVKKILGEDKELKISISHSDNYATCVAIVYYKVNQ
ncbi:MAG: holo-[acyl-carrier-protein] synthase [Ignavibacteriales bacterium CG18_big_fil_WC_8_21_14_2_50_31_20]|nr:MAG: holo-[acyl-carrier-protein] synthase [Ignavibacteriales bacterium CG18_big_fil_WC_8_21_14_2_50_31_20]